MTNFSVSWKSAGKVNFLKAKVIKRRAWKTLNVISTLAIVLNTGLIGSFLTPNVAGATGTGAVCPAGNVKLNIDSGYEYNDGSGTINGNGTTVTWAPAAGFVVTSVCVKIGGHDGGTLIYPTVGNGTYTTTSNNISHAVLYTDQLNPDLKIKKYAWDTQSSSWKNWDPSDDYAWANPGDTVNFMVKVWNVGSETGVTNISDSLDSGTNGIWQSQPTPDTNNVTLIGGAASEPAFTAGGNTDGTTNFYVYTYTGTLKSWYANDAEYYSINKAQLSQNNQYSKAKVKVAYQCDLVVTKTGTPSVTPGGTITYTLHYENKGTANCTGGGVLVKDTIPAATTFVSASPSVTPVSNVLTWNLGTIPPLVSGDVKASGDLTFTVTANDKPEVRCDDWTIENQAKYWASEFGSNNWKFTDSNPDLQGTQPFITSVTAPCSTTLTIIKNVINDNGGNSQPNEFNLSIGGAATLSGVPMTVEANTPYVISESLTVPGYTFVSITGDAKCPTYVGGSITLDEGDDITCTFTNDDIAPKLTLVKTITNDNGGNAQPNDFKLTIGGAATLSGVPMTVMANTPYAINETSVDGYTFVSITGDKRCPANLGVTISLNEGDNVTCTITNTRDTGDLIVHKNVLNPDGNEVTDTHAFTVTLNGGDQKTIAEGTDATYSNLPTGSYSMVENHDNDYDFSGWYPTGSTEYSCNNPKEKTLPISVDVAVSPTTEITLCNKQKKAKITISKDVRDFQGKGVNEVGNFSVTSDAGDFTIAEYDPEVLSVNPGTYTFKELAHGNYTIHSTNPKEITVGSNGEEAYTFENWQKPSYITGQKFEDHNGTGTKKDAGDQGLANWEICIGAQNCTLTDVNGNYSFGPLASGTYTVTETQQTGWTQTAPKSTHVVTLGINQTVVDKDFGNFQLGKIWGYKYDTLDNPLDDWKICLNADNCEWTDGNGFYEFTDLEAGDYTVYEDLTNVTGWYAVWPNVLGIHETITINSGDKIQKDFVNFQGVNISGSKFNDLNGNGEWDSGEPGLPDWTIQLLKDEDGFEVADSATTDVNGNYTFGPIGPGDYRVREVQQSPTWTQATSNPEDFTTVSGQDVNGLDFGNYKYGRISGYKYDNDEEPLDGWQICLVKNQPELNTISRVSIQEPNCKITGTGEWQDGYYEFTGLTTGEYSVSETQQYGWTQIAPEGNVFNISVQSGTDSKNNDFWNRKNTFNVSIDKVAAESVNAGENLTYTLNWSVTGNTPVEVKLFDVLPANTTFVSATGSGTLDVNTVRWNLGTKTPADSGFVTLTVKVNSPLDKGTIIANTGNICGLGAIADGEPFFSNGEDLRRQKCDDDPATTTVNAEPLLGIAKVANPTTVGGNQNVTYTVTWSVAGNSKATNVVVTDPIPASTTYVSMGCGTTTGTCTMSTTGTPVTSTTWNLGIRLPGEGGTLTLVVKTAISVPNGSVIPNKATIAAQDIDPVFAAADVKAATAPQLQITKTANATIVNPGDPISYTVKVKNIGTDTAVNAVMTDTLPAGFTFVSTSPVATSIVGQTGTWNLGDMAVGAEKTITYTVNVTPGTTAGTYDNIAKAKANNAPEVSTKVPVQTRVPQVLGETTNPVLQLRKSVSKATVAPGDTVTYTVEIKNTGTGSAINVILTDLLPVGFAFKGTDLTTKEWKLGDIGVGETKTVSYKVTVGKSVPNGSYENLAIAQADNHGKVTTSVPVQVKRGRVLAEVVDTGAGPVDLAVAGVGLGLIVLGFVLTRKRGEELA
ncbi:MAG: SdrD B-like domain-containing protein [Patescibacteria group bacterium]